MTLSIILYFGLAFAISLGLTPAIIHISHRNKWYDHHNNRKIHASPTPRLGGVSIFLAFILSALIPSLLFSSPQNEHHIVILQFFTTENLLLLLGLLLIHIIGLIDDFHNIKALYKFSGQILSGIFVMLGGIFINGIYMPIFQTVIPLGPLGNLIFLFWLVSISNALNLTDGMDGLAGGTALIASLGIGCSHILMGNTVGALYSAMIFGSVLGFLIFNKPIAKVFMGDSGSHFLGFLLASLMFIRNKESSVNTLYFQSGFILASTVLIIPIIDMITSILRRIHKGRPIYEPDREHLHHKFIALGMSQWSILVIVSLLNFIMAGVIVLHSWLFLQGKLLLGDIILITSWLLPVILFIVLHYVYKNGVDNNSCSPNLQ